jgi:hypothetical protein
MKDYSKMTDDQINNLVCELLGCECFDFCNEHALAYEVQKALCMNVVFLRMERKWSVCFSMLHDDAAAVYLGAYLDEHGDEAELDLVGDNICRLIFESLLATKDLLDKCEETAEKQRERFKSISDRINSAVMSKKINPVDLDKIMGEIEYINKRVNEFVYE